MGKVIYLAGPIGNGHTVDPRKMYQNVRQAEEVMLKLMNKGWSVICPHLSYYPYLHWADHVHWQRWLDMDADFVRKADAFFYMKPEVYGPSKGAAQELEWAKEQNKEIYDDINTIPSIDPQLIIDSVCKSCGENVTETPISG